MIPMKQDQFAELNEQGAFIKRGNCILACIASVLEIPLRAVPPFDKVYGLSNFKTHLNMWLSYYGLQFESLYHQPHDFTDEFFIVSGGSPRFPGKGVSHFCVWHKGQIVHDPHPDNTGLLVPTRWYRLAKVLDYDGVSNPVTPNHRPLENYAANPDRC
jgi:hypothetical protein